MIISEKNLTPFDANTMKEIEEGLTIADGEKLGHFDITANGDYAASTQGMAGFSDVHVDVPNTYTVQDEGKVVNSGELVAQTAMAEEITENNTYDTTNYNSITVNVAGSQKTVINVHCTEDSVVTHDSTMSFDEIVAAIEAGNVTFTITDDSRAEYQDPLVYAGSWVYYDYPDLPLYFIVATGHTSDSGLSFIFTEDSGRKDYITVPD